MDAQRVLGALYDNGHILAVYMSICIFLIFQLAAVVNTLHFSLSLMQTVQ